MEMNEICSMQRTARKNRQQFSPKTWKDETVWKTQCKPEANIKMDLLKMRCPGINWIHLGPNRFHKRCEIYWLLSTISFSRRTLLCGIRPAILKLTASHTMQYVATSFALNTRHTSAIKANSFLCSRLYAVLRRCRAVRWNTSPPKQNKSRPNSRLVPKSHSSLAMLAAVTIGCSFPRWASRSISQLLPTTFFNICFRFSKMSS